MEMKLKQTNEQYLYRIVLAVTAIAALLPVACNYIMTGGIIYEWIARIEELALELRLFPSTDTFLGMWSRENAMDSNLWFFPAGIIYRMSDKLVLTYRIYMLVLQICTLLFAKLFFERLFADRKTKLPGFFGILLYMTSPYRIYVCYDLADLSGAVVWMVLPLYAWSVLGLLFGSRRRRDIAVASLALAGIGYADIMYFFILIGVTIFAVLYFKKALPVITMITGSILLIPVLYRLFRYLFLDAYFELEIPVRTIMQNGYRFGQFFNSYAFRENHPGMGLGIFICLLSGLWIWFVADGEKVQRRERFFIVLSAILLLLSLRFFPWDYVQRLGVWSLKLISLINTPAIFAGLAWNCLCIPAAASVDRMSEQENKLIAHAIPLMVLLACIGLCVYQCNMLTYSRFPMNVL